MRKKLRDKKIKLLKIFWMTNFIPIIILRIQIKNAKLRILKIYIYANLKINYSSIVILHQLVSPKNFILKLNLRWWTIVSHHKSVCKSVSSLYSHKRIKFNCIQQTIMTSWIGGWVVHFCCQWSIINFLFRKSFICGFVFRRN